MEVVDFYTFHIYQMSSIRYWKMNEWMNETFEDPTIWKYYNENIYIILYENIIMKIL